MMRRPSQSVTRTGGGTRDVPVLGVQAAVHTAVHTAVHMLCTLPCTLLCTLLCTLATSGPRDAMPRAHCDAGLETLRSLLLLAGGPCRCREAWALSESRDCPCPSHVTVRIRVT
eukprot:1960961-Rhodomonas_salina.3